MRYINRFPAFAGALALASLTYATDYTESEGTTGNSTRDTANTITTLQSGDRIIGSSTGSAGFNTQTSDIASLDYFRFGVAGDGPGIYQNRLTVTKGKDPSTKRSPGNYFSKLVGYNSDNSSVESYVQFNHYAYGNEFYTFGAPTEMTWSVYGLSTTAGETYIATYAYTKVTPEDLGTVSGGLTFTGVAGSTQPGFMLLDGNYNTIASNAAGGGTNTSLTQNLAPGTYYLGVSSDEILSHSTTGFAQTYDSGIIAATTERSDPVTVGFSLTDGSQTIAKSYSQTGSYDVKFYSFKVQAVPEPASFLPLGLGALAVLRRRRRA